MLILAELQASQTAVSPPARTEVSAPQGARPLPSTNINVVLPPNTTGGFTTPASKTETIETPEIRKQRLENAGIISTPTPVPKESPQKTEETPLEKLVAEVATKNGELPPLFLRNEISLGSWKMIKPPPGTRSVEDFSYGFAMYVNLDINNPPIKNTWTSNLYAGGEALFWNDGIYVNVSSPYNDIQKLYADRSVMEIGPSISLLSEYHSSKIYAWFIEPRLDILLLRWIRTEYKSQVNAPKQSEATTKFLINYLGFGAQLSAGINIARTGSFGFFTGVHLAKPTQIRMRYGINISLTTPWSDNTEETEQ